jgi:hypothetical protein
MNRTLQVDHFLLHLLLDLFLFRTEMMQRRIWVVVVRVGRHAEVTEGAKERRMRRYIGRVIHVI